jgi:HSP20 family protein
MAIIRWRPMRDFMTVQDEMNRMFDRFFSREPWEGDESMSTAEWSPTVDISENKDEYFVSAELPGMKKEDVQITYANNVLRIEGERRKEEEKQDTNYHRVERLYGKFCRTFQVPTQIQADKIAADFKNGILTVHLPKAEEAKPKEVQIKIS